MAAWTEDGGIVFTAAQMVEAGARVMLDYQGQVDIERGLLRRADASEGTVTAPKVPRSAYSSGLIRELTAHRTAALRLELSRRPDVALASVVYAFITAYRDSERSVSSLTISVKYPTLLQHVWDVGSCAAHAALGDELARWDNVLSYETEELWQWCLSLPQDALLSALALFTALTVDTVQAQESHHPSANLVHGRQLAAELDLDMTRHWQPTAAFMARLSRAAMAEALRETGQQTAAANVMVMKKDTAAAVAAEAMRNSGWLPPVLRRPEAVADNDNAAVPAEDDVGATVGQDQEAA